ncbi:MAG: hypothetical protein NXH85_18575 [Pseudomonadaceae bacterium]|nr:hypothetical protein [Pseudomonadaceae bacterium]
MSEQKSLDDERTQRIRNSAAYKGLNELLTRIRAPEIEPTDPKAIFYLQRWEESIRYSIVRINSCNTDLFPFAVLDTLQGNCTNLLNAYNGLIGGDESSLQRNDNHVDQLLITVSQVPQALSQNAQETEEEINKVRSVARRGTEAVSELVEEVSEKVTTLGEALDEHEAKLEAQRTEQARLESEFRTEFNNEQTHRTNIFNDQVKTNKDETSALRSRVDTSIKTIEERWDKEVEPSRNAFITLLDQKKGAVTEKSESTKKELARMEEKARELLGLISNTAVVGGYQNNAKDLQRERRNWSYAAVGSFVAMAICVLLVDFSGSGPLDVLTRWLVNSLDLASEFPVGDSTASNEWLSIAKRTLAIVSLSIVGGYCARQSSNAGKRERYYRDRELELAAFNPFIDDLAEDEKRSLRTDVARKSFVPSEQKEPE